MKKMLALILSVTSILSFTACSSIETDNLKPQAAIPNQSENSEPDGTVTMEDQTATTTENTVTSPESPATSTEPTGASSEINDNSTSQDNTDLYGVLTSTIDSYGFPFRLWNSKGADYYDFIFTEDYVQREIFVNFDGPHTTPNLSWSITENELVVSGEWEETFVIDMDSGVATSVTDGKEYRISIQKQDGEYLVWQQLISGAE